MKTLRVLSVGLLALLLGACGSGTPVTVPTPTLAAPTTVPAMATVVLATPTATSAPSAVAAPTAAPPPTAGPAPTRPPQTIDLGAGRWLDTQAFEGQDDTLNYAIKAQWPVVAGATTPQIEQFNLAAQQLVTDTLHNFRQTQTTPLPEAGGFIDVNYQVMNASNGLLSILFDVNTYTGGAHANTTHIPLNFDLNTGQALTLNDVFKPGVDAVAAVAAIASEELTRTNRLVFPDGAEPAPPNYQVWNFDFNNLLITFEEYQVMPFAAGPQIVAVPYYRLKDDLNPASPLADFWQLTER